MTELTPDSVMERNPDRESLGKRVRAIWIAWAKEQPTSKASWLKPWDELTEPEREVDRRIGATIWQEAQAGFARPSDATMQKLAEKAYEWTIGCITRKEAVDNVLSVLNEVAGARNEELLFWRKHGTALRNAACALINDNASLDDDAIVAAVVEAKTKINRLITENEMLRSLRCGKCGRQVTPDGDCYGCEMDRLAVENKQIRTLMQEAVDNCEVCRGEHDAGRRCARCKAFAAVLEAKGEPTDAETKQNSPDELTKEERDLVWRITKSVKAGRATRDDNEIIDCLWKTKQAEKKLIESIVNHRTK